MQQLILGIGYAIQWMMEPYCRVRFLTAAIASVNGTLEKNLNLGVVERSGISKRYFHVKRRHDVFADAVVDFRRLWGRRRRRRRQHGRRKVGDHRLNPVARFRGFRISENGEAEVGKNRSGGFPGFRREIQEPFVDACGQCYKTFYGCKFLKVKFHKNCGILTRNVKFFKTQNQILDYFNQLSWTGAASIVRNAFSPKTHKSNFLTNDPSYGVIGPKSNWAISIDP